jgi:peptidyl-tRNA hydrolase
VQNWFRSRQRDVVAKAGTRLALGSVETPNSAAFTCRAMTDAHGGFVFTGVPPGEYTARAEAPGYRPLDQKVTAKPFDPEAGRPPSMTLCLEPR